MLGYKMHLDGFDGAETGWERGRQLAMQQYISPEDVRVIRNWFARHKHVSRPASIIRVFTA
jgi:hypothetical protein